MRLLAFILACLTIVLSTFPCADRVYPSSEGVATYDQHFERSNDIHSHEASDHDACTPFCHCTCCAGFSLMPTIDFFQKPYFTSIRPLYTMYRDKGINEVFFPVWQPPQLFA